MRVYELRVGTELLDGRVIVTALKRLGTYTMVTLASGNIVRKVKLHKTQPIAVALVGITAAGKATGSMTAMPHKPRASNPMWRGETSASNPTATWERKAPNRRNATGGITGEVRADSRY